MNAVLCPLALLVFVPVVGCGDRAGAASTHEAVASQATGTLEEMVVVLEGVTDDASKAAAKGQIEALVDRIEDLVARLPELGEPDTATLERITTEMKVAMQDLGVRVAGIAFKAMSDPKLQELFSMLTDAMGRIRALGK